MFRDYWGYIILNHYESKMRRYANFYFFQRKDTKSSKSNENTKLYEMKIQELSDELAKVSSRLKRYEEAATQPSPLLLQLSDEMNGLKRHHNDVIDKERQRANEAEETLKQFSTMEEERIAVLGNFLSEMVFIVQII